MLIPGRELDTLVAEKIFKLDVIKTVWGKNKQYSSLTLGEPSYYDDQGEMKLHNPLPNYSTNIAEAWSIVEKLPYVFEITTNNPYTPSTPETEWLATFDIEYVAFGTTAPQAICIAALIAVGYKSQVDT